MFYRVLSMPLQWHLRKVLYELLHHDMSLKSTKIIPTSSLRKKCSYPELLWSVFFRIRTEYGEILRISPYSVQMRENTDQNNSEYGHFSRSA